MPDWKSYLTKSLKQESTEKSTVDKHRDENALEKSPRNEDLVSTISALKQNQDLLLEALNKQQEVNNKLLEKIEQLNTTGIQSPNIVNSSKPDTVNEETYIPDPTKNTDKKHRVAVEESKSTNRSLDKASSALKQFRKGKKPGDK